MKLKYFACCAALAAVFATGPALADVAECDKAAIDWMNTALDPKAMFHDRVIGKLKIMSTQGIVSSTAKKLVCKVRVRHTFLNEDVEFLNAHLMINLKADGSIRGGDLVFLEGSKSRH